MKAIAVYTTLSRLLQPLLLPVTAARWAAGKEDFLSAAQRFGFCLPPLAPPTFCSRNAASASISDISGGREGEGKGSGKKERGLVYYHAASVGEGVSLLPLLLHPSAPARQHITIGTLTGREVVKKRLKMTGRFATLHRDDQVFVADDGSVISVSASTFDTPAACARALSHFNPSSVVIVENEIWPNLLHTAHARLVPLTLLSGRMSNTSMRRWKTTSFSSSLLSSCLHLFSSITSSSSAYLDFVSTFSVPSSSLFLLPPLKLASLLPSSSSPSNFPSPLLSFFSSFSPTLVCGCSHIDEEEVGRKVVDKLVAALRQSGGEGERGRQKQEEDMTGVCKRTVDTCIPPPLSSPPPTFSPLSPPLLVLAPRYPKRAMAVKRWMQQNGWKVYLRSEVGGERGDEVEKTRRVSVSGLSESEVGKWGQGKVCLVWDTLGDVDLAYAAANVTIVGGSTRRGAHSPVEAVREGSAVVMGNEVGAAADLSSFFSASHPSSFFACSSTAEVEQRCLSLLLSAHACARWGEEGRTGKAASEGEVEARCEKGGGGQGEKERERAEWMEKRRRDAQSSMKAISHLSLTAAVSHLQQAGVWQEVK